MSDRRKEAGNTDAVTPIRRGIGLAKVWEALKERLAPVWMAGWPDSFLVVGVAQFYLTALLLWHLGASVAGVSITCSLPCIITNY